MKYYLKEFYAKENHAGSKARLDAEKIMIEAGYHPFFQNNDSNSITLTENDVLVLQFPLLWHSLKTLNLTKLLRKRQFKAYLLIHDIESLRNRSIKSFQDVKYAILHFLQNKTVLERVDGIIAHNDKMKEVLVQLGISEKKIISLEIFDYLIPHYEEKKTYEKRTVLVAGNFDIKKAKYARQLPDNPEFSIFGINFDEEHLPQNVHYKGAFSPEELPYYLEGGFGLVWDGDSPYTCSGMFGEYLKMNNPHKASLYLASGFPIIVWRQSALSDFVTKNNCGILVDSLFEIAERLDSISNDEYEELIRNSKKIGDNIRNGHYLKIALEKCERKL
ncbi:galactofuranosyltransferase [Granulicatella sp.]